MPLRCTARTEFLKPKFNHLLTALANVMELGIVLLVFPDVQSSPYSNNSDNISMRLIIQYMCLLIKRTMNTLQLHSI
jgi:hypothetical protein